MDRYEYPSDPYELEDQLERERRLFDSRLRRGEI